MPRSQHRARAAAVALTLVLACGEADDGSPAPVGSATAGMVSVGATFGGGGDGASASGAGTGGGGSGGGSSESSGSSGGASTCMASGEACDTEGVCIAIGNGFGCGHGAAGDPCEQANDCPTGSCILQPTGASVPGVCSGLPCDSPGAPCENDGNCVLQTEGATVCSHGNVGEPCTTDAQCMSMSCSSTTQLCK
ncbi:MAG: hypothetical protein K1X88_07630 [Nannocystaceae bacterium]|nr:hypothetical protein [Nannocystaceae bacterium]